MVSGDPFAWLVPIRHRARRPPQNRKRLAGLGQTRRRRKMANPRHHLFPTPETVQLQPNPSAMDDPTSPAPSRNSTSPRTAP